MMILLLMVTLPICCWYHLAAWIQLFYLVAKHIIKWAIVLDCWVGADVLGADVLGAGVLNWCPAQVLGGAKQCCLSSA